jgi:hypothetical protein
MKKQMFSIVLLLSLGVTATTKSNVLSTGAQTIFKNLLGKGSFGLSQLFAVEGRGITGGEFITLNPTTVVDSMVNPVGNPIIVRIVNQATPPAEQVVQTSFGQAVGTMADSVTRFVGSGFDALKNAGHVVRDYNYGQAFEVALEKGELAAQTLQEKVAHGTQYVFDAAQHAQHTVRNFDYAGTAQALGATVQNNAQVLAESVNETAQSVVQVAKNEFADLKEGVGVASQQVQHAAEFAQGYVTDAVLNAPQTAQAGVGRLQDCFHAVTALTVDGVKQAAQTVMANPTETAYAAFNAVKDAVIANPGKTAFGLVGGYAANKLAKGHGFATRTLATAGGALTANFVSEEMARVALATGIAAKFVVANVKAVRAKIKQNSERKIKDQNEAINKFVNERILNRTNDRIANGLNIIAFINPSYPSTIVVIRNGNTSISRSYQFFTGADYKAMYNANDEEKTGYINQATQDVEMLQSLPDTLKASVIDYLIALESYFKDKTKAAKAQCNQSKKALKQVLESYNFEHSMVLSA